MPAIHAPFPKVSLRGGRSALQIGRALGPFTSGQAGQGTVPTHNHPSSRPPSTPNPPTLPSDFSLALNSSLGGGQPNVVPG